MKHLLLLNILALAACDLGANIQDNCTVNGLGTGSCQFTNTGPGSGTLCGRVKLTNVSNSRSDTSPLFCSGEVASKATTTVAFQMSAPANGVCEVDNPSYAEVGSAAFDNRKSWTDVCSLEFVPEK